MIIDHISNRAFYYGLGENFRTALDYFALLSEGKKELPENMEHDINLADGVSIRVRPMITKPAEQCRIESHEKEADIHFVPYGIEKIGYVPLEGLELEEANPERDISFWYGQSEQLTLKSGFFMIAFPQDAHMPCGCGEEPAFLLKLIAKIRL